MATMREFREIGFDVTSVPRNAHWIAMDEDGAWYWYQTKPARYISRGKFVMIAPSYGRIAPKDEPSNFLGHWTESLMKIT